MFDKLTKQNLTLDEFNVLVQQYKDQFNSDLNNLRLDAEYSPVLTDINYWKYHTTESNNIEGEDVSRTIEILSAFRQRMEDEGCTTRRKYSEYIITELDVCGEDTDVAYTAIRAGWYEIDEELHPTTLQINMRNYVRHWLNPSEDGKPYSSRYIDMMNFIRFTEGDITWTRLREIIYG